MTQSESDQTGLSHGHGWGIVTYDDEATEDRQAWAAYHGEHFRRSAAKVYANLVLAHVRRATVGEPAVENTHPFKHKHWAFAHNGTVPLFDKIRSKILSATDENFREHIYGQTDSEHIFFYALSLIHRHPEHSLESIVQQLVTDILGWINEVGATRKPGLNLVITDGNIIAGTRFGRTLFHVHRNGVYDCEICGFPHIHHQVNREHRAVVVASEPLTDERWIPFPGECSWTISDSAELTINEQRFSALTNHHGNAALQT